MEIENIKEYLFVKFTPNNHDDKKTNGSDRT